MCDTQKGCSQVHVEDDDKPSDFGCEPKLAVAGTQQKQHETTNSCWLQLRPRKRWNKHMTAQAWVAVSAPGHSWFFVWASSEFIPMLSHVEVEVS